MSTRPVEAASLPQNPIVPNFMYNCFSCRKRIAVLSDNFFACYSCVSLFCKDSCMIRHHCYPKIYEYIGGKNHKLRDLFRQAAVKIAYKQKK